MLRSAHHLFKYRLQAIDGEIGRCEDFLFDDQHWAIRYMVAETGKWLSDKKVLISPISLEKPLWDKKLFPVRLLKQKIMESPSLELHEPVSRKYEREYLNFYRYPLYWNGAGIWGTGAYPMPLYDEASVDKKEEELGAGAESSEKSHLRSMKEIMGYGVHSSTGRFGHIEDLIIDDKNWMVCDLVVDTVNFFPSKSVVVPRELVGEVDWFERTVSVHMAKEVIKESPAFHGKSLLSEDFQLEVNKYYNLNL